MAARAELVQEVDLQLAILLGLEAVNQTHQGTSRPTLPRPKRFPVPKDYFEEERPARLPNIDDFLPGQERRRRPGCSVQDPLLRDSEGRPRVTQELEHIVEAEGGYGTEQ